jgi:DNA-binding winged helix-turn-helix (wHTH) protein
MHTNAYPEREGPAQWRKSSLPRHATWSSWGRADAALEFGCFRVLLRRRWLLVDGVPVELGARAFDLLVALLEAGGALVTKGELLDQVWPGIVVSEQNLKVQISALRKAFGADRNLIRTEFGRGYRFIGILRSNATAHGCRDPSRAKLRSVGVCFRRTAGNRSSVVPVRARQSIGCRGRRVEVIGYAIVDLPRDRSSGGVRPLFSHSALPAESFFMPAGCWNELLISSKVL